MSRAISHVRSLSTCMCRSSDITSSSRLVRHKMKNFEKPHFSPISSTTLLTRICLLQRIYLEVSYVMGFQFTLVTDILEWHGPQMLFSKVDSMKENISGTYKELTVGRTILGGIVSSANKWCRVYTTSKTLMCSAEEVAENSLCRGIVYGLQTDKAEEGQVLDLAMICNVIWIEIRLFPATCKELQRSENYSWTQMPSVAHKQAVFGFVFQEFQGVHAMQAIRYSNMRSGARNRIKIWPCHKTSRTVEQGEAHNHSHSLNANAYAAR